MRRKDREMTREFGLELIDRAQYGVLSMVDTDKLAYGVPLSLVRDGDKLYFHSAMDGKKVRGLKENPDVSVTFVGQVQVPDNYTKDDLDEMKGDPSKAINFISSVFTTEFESVVVSGQVNLVEDEEEKVKAMRLICNKYTPDKMDYFQVAINTGLSRTNIYRISMDSVGAKRKKYDLDGVEMKWGREY